MKKILVLSLVLLVALASCKKDDVTLQYIPASTINALVDNVPVSFNMLTMADTTFHSYSGYITVIEGWQGDVANSDFVSFSLVRPHRLSPGIYTPSSFSYWHQSDSTMYNFASEDSAQIVITAITDSSIEGTFGGTVYKNGYSGLGSPSLLITDGKFNVKFSNAF
jgi:hypothetical protein